MKRAPIKKPAGTASRKPPKSKATAPDVASLPQTHSSLATLYASALTAASFLAPKGVRCTVAELSATVRALSGLELTPLSLRQMAALDAGLGLRHVVDKSGDITLELVLRESLRMVATPGAVRSRHKKFCALLCEHATLELPVAPLPPMPDGLPPPAASPSRRGGGSSSTAEMSGLPSPPPRPLRRANLAATLTPPEAAAGRHSEREAEPEDMAAPAAQQHEMKEGDKPGSIGQSQPVVERFNDVLTAAIGDELDETPAPPLPATSTSTESSSSASASSAATFPSSDDAPPASSTVASAPPVSSTLRFLRALRRSPFYRDQVVHYHEQAARPAAYATPTSALAPAVVTCLDAAGRSSLYSHQAEAVDTLLSGGHVMLCTPTASGKSLGYLVPTLQWMSTDSEARCLYIFPTKALAQDQMRALRELSCSGGTSLFGLPVHTYDGDTPQAERAEHRASTKVFLTNPDMLHCAMVAVQGDVQTASLPLALSTGLPYQPACLATACHLPCHLPPARLALALTIALIESLHAKLPHHTDWARVLTNLRLVVIDEAHMYKGEHAGIGRVISLPQACRCHAAALAHTTRVLPVFRCFRRTRGADTPQAASSRSAVRGIPLLCVLLRHCGQPTRALHSADWVEAAAR